jgi:hypothetical protein
MAQVERSESARRESERYRAAAEEALDQLDWCVAYLHRIRKSAVADVIARNRSEIRRRMR